MKKEYVIGIIVAVLVIGSTIAFGFLSGGPEDVGPVEMPDRSGTSGADGPGIAPMFTMAEVRSHNTADDCWTVIGTTVYDLTDWVSQHPGGEAAIRGLCGTDGTAAFESQHGDDSEPNQQLSEFFRGTIRLGEN
jgi:hypothetical protein